MKDTELREHLDRLYRECEQASRRGEVPVAAIVADDRGFVFASNEVEERRNPFEHAEVLALERMLQKRGGHYLGDATLLVSLEPCLMCMGAILKAGIRDLYYVLDDERMGALSHYHVFVDDVLRVHRVKDDRFLPLLQRFFQERRERGDF